MQSSGLDAAGFCLGASKIQLNCSFSSSIPASMTETVVERFRSEAEQCHKLAESARNLADKEAWLGLAADWIKLAENAQERRSKL